MRCAEDGFSDGFRIAFSESLFQKKAIGTIYADGVIKFVWIREDRELPLLVFRTRSDSFLDSIFNSLSFWVLLFREFVVKARDGHFSAPGNELKDLPPPPLPCRAISVA